MSTHELQPRAFEQSGHVEVAGDYVRSQSPLVLPSHRCVKCGSVEPGGAIHRDVVNYVNPFVWLTFLISGLITIIAYFWTRKPIHVQYYLCPKCEDKRRIRGTTTSLVLFISVIGLFMSIMGGPFEMFLGAFIIALISRLLFVRPPLSAAVHDNGWFALRGASPKMLAALQRKELDQGSWPAPHGRFTEGTAPRRDE